MSVTKLKNLKNTLLILTVLFFGFNTSSYSVSNQDLMDRLDDMEFEQEMREHERRMKQLMRDLERQREQSILREKREDELYRPRNQSSPQPPVQYYYLPPPVTPIQTEPSFKIGSRRFIGFKKTSNLREMIDNPNYSYKEIETNGNYWIFLNTKSIKDNQQGYKSINVVTISDIQEKTTDGLKYFDTNQHVNIKCKNSEVNFNLVSYLSDRGDVLRQTSSSDWVSIKNKNSNLLKIKDFICK